MAAADRVAVTLRLPRDIHEELARAAKADRRSANAMAVVLIERGLRDARP